MRSYPDFDCPQLNALQLVDGQNQFGLGMAEVRFGKTAIVNKAIAIKNLVLLTLWVATILGWVSFGDQ